MEQPLSLPLLMDGATGTELQKHGMPRDCCPQRWALEHPEALLAVQRSYVAAGARMLLTPTAGANGDLLARWGLEDQVEHYNRALCALTRSAAGPEVLVAGSLGPVGAHGAAGGEQPFEQLVDLYARQAAALDQADLFVAETLTSMAQGRAALLACRRVAPEKAVIVTCCCDQEGRMPQGTDVLAAGIVLQGMGAAAFGVNCCTPEVAQAQLERLAPYLTLPLVAKPSAGLPGPEGDYDLDTGALARRAAAWAAAGARLFGGCCGTEPRHIQALGAAVAAVDVSALPERLRDPDVIPCASREEARFITPDVDVGTPIRCTPDLMEDILEAEEQNPVGALKIEILDQDDLDLFSQEQYAIRDALCLWSDVPELMEGALRAYQGRAFYDGTAGLEPEVLERLSREYGLIIL